MLVRGLRAVAVGGVAVVCGVVGGAVTAVAQGVLPAGIASVANSVAPWVGVAFLVATLARRAWVGSLAGGLTLAGLLAGYVLASAVRGYPSSSGLLVFWGVAAVVVGPVVGLGAYWLRRGPVPSSGSVVGPAPTGRDVRPTPLASTGSAVKPALAAGGLGGLLVGEGAYGLMYVAATTSPLYWWAEVAVGVVVLAGLAGWRLRHWRPRALAVVTAAGVAVAFVLLYSRGGSLISLL